MAKKKTVKAVQKALRKQRADQLVRLHRLCALMERHRPHLLCSAKDSKYPVGKMGDIIDALSNVLCAAIDTLARAETHIVEEENGKYAELIEYYEIMTQPLIGIHELDRMTYKLYYEENKEEHFGSYINEHLKFVIQLQKWVRNVEFHQRYLEILGSSSKTDQEVVATMTDLLGRLATLTANATGALHSPASTVLSKDVWQKWHKEAEALASMFAFGIVVKLRHLPPNPDARAVAPPPAVTPGTEPDELTAKPASTLKEAIVLH
ncbi:hypothetical protein [Nitrospirillum pindoramense]|uniref:Uncharacterized protein n=1 Tax=Nitrospirillum amazonense TaxID=28077 RepID=A0A560GL49_9PROT|nr:hypothetical protein [Nitrospirillum amazonense]TWB34334.1 hypothetical protein FBZ90_12634 [Nitrospirillum amazonense]